tara:strand:- start:1878 stop:2966 length:1089 start_codon:yes stop_codon:yes gene_type:complete
MADKREQQEAFSKKVAEVNKKRAAERKAKAAKRKKKMEEITANLESKKPSARQLKRQALKETMSDMKRKTKIAQAKREGKRLGQPAPGVMLTDPGVRKKPETAAQKAARLRKADEARAQKAALQRNKTDPAPAPASKKKKTRQGGIIGGIKTVLLGKDQKFGGDRGAIDFLRKKKKPAAKAKAKAKVTGKPSMVRSDGGRNVGSGDTLRANVTKEQLQKTGLTLNKYLNYMDENNGRRPPKAMMLTKKRMGGMMKSKMASKGGARGGKKMPGGMKNGGLAMTTVNGRKVPAFAADGKGANDLAKKKNGGMMKSKGMAKGGAMKKKGYAKGGMAKKGYSKGGAVRGKPRGVGAATRGYGKALK